MLASNARTTSRAIHRARALGRPTLFALAATLALLGCTDSKSPGYLVVDVATPLTPGIDFDTVRLDVFEGDSTEGARALDPVADSVGGTDSFDPAYRMIDDGEQSLANGMYLAELTLSRGAERIDSLRRGFEMQGTTAIAFNFSQGPACSSAIDCGGLLSADCAAVDCIADVCQCVCGTGGDAGCESVEICSNGIDDDEDGLVDCLDTDCEGRACDDGDLCTIHDICASGLCNARFKECGSENPCIEGTCDPGTGACIEEPLADGDPCNAHPNRCCSGVCVDLSGDENNCGSCGIVCASGRCDDLGNGRAACFCNGTAECKTGNVCYDPTGDGLAADANHCDCDVDNDCGSGAMCASATVGAIDHCFYP